MPLSIEGFFMKSESQKAYEKVQARLLQAPGMIEESERRLLFKAAFKSNLPVVEFGAFFGASTLALASGVAASENSKRHIYCFDAFEVKQNHPFHKHVIDYAARSNAKHLLRQKNGYTNWEEVTKSVIGNDLIDLVKFKKTIVGPNLKKSDLPEKIGLLHLDLPKDAETIKPIAEIAFPNVQKGGTIAFQDCAYHFSNELIAYFELLEQNNILRMTAIAASSTFYEVITDQPHNIDWSRLLENVGDNNIQVELLHSAIRRYTSLQNSRSQEIIAMNGALIKGILENKAPISIADTIEIKNYIQNISKLDTERAAFVIAELLSEKLEKHR